VTDLFHTVSDLAKTGFAGVGIIVFLLLFILLLRGKPIDGASAKLYNRFLTWGVGFAVFSGVLSIITLVAAPAPAKADAQVMINMSPQFETRKLTPPVITLNGKDVKINQLTPWNGGTIFVSVDQALQDVDDIKQTVKAYGDNIKALRADRDALINAVPPGVGVVADAGSVKAASAKSVMLQSEVKQAIEVGDFSRAARMSAQLNAPELVKSSAIRREMIARPSN
jgi:hypothetical protein